MSKRREERENQRISMRIDLEVLNGGERMEERKNQRMSMQMEEKRSDLHQPRVAHPLDGLVPSLGPRCLVDGLVPSLGPRCLEQSSVELLSRLDERVACSEGAVSTVSAQHHSIRQEQHDSLSTAALA